LDIPPREMHETEDFDDLYGVIYVERSTSLLYEVKFFADFILVRPASPTFYLSIRKMTPSEFADEFDEYSGNHDEVMNHIRGLTPDLIIE
jgi:hypothetical protein